jgi:Stress responsive A/B Barrel Domain
MYAHIFAFRWKPGVTQDQKQRAASEIRSLQGQIPGLLETAVGSNISPRGQGYEFGGLMKFADKESLERYGMHPVHQALLQWLVPLIEPIEVDFPIEVDSEI